MTNNEQRVELHLHTKYSKMDALVDVNNLMRRTADEEWPAVAITDHGSVQAFPEAQRAAKKYGVKVIYGLEAYCCDDSNETAADKYYHMILLVQNNAGLKNLYELVSCANTENKDDLPRIPKSALDKHRDGLLVGSACVCGELFDATLSCKPMVELEKIAAYYDYLEIQPVCNNHFLISNGTVKTDDELRRLNISVAELAARIHKPLVATGDVHFLDPEDEIARSVLLSVRGIENANDSLPLYYKSTEEMLEEFSYLGEEAAYCAVVTNTRAIADSIESVEPVPRGTYPPRIDGAVDKIKQESTARAEELYGNPLPALVKEQLDWELSVIKKHDFWVYFAVAEKLVKRSNENGFTVGSRGAVAASFVAYLLGVTEVNPLSAHYICGQCRHSEFYPASAYITGFDLPDKTCPVCGERMRKDGFNIPVETFFAEDGSKVPDIDLNFAGDYQKQAAEHLKEIFGREHTLRAGAVYTISERLAQGYAERYATENGQQLYEDDMESIVSAICGVKRSDGLHPGAYVVVPNDMEVTDFCPLDKRHGERVTHFDSYSMHCCLIRFDIFGHNTPTLLKELEDMTGTDSRAIPLDDEDTLRLFETADTVALPEFGSDYAIRLLKTIKPVSISELIKTSGFVHGTGTWDGNTEKLINSGAASIKEVISTRDDVFIYLMGVGMNRYDAYTVMEYARKGKLYVGPEMNNSDAVAKRRAELEDMLRRYGAPDWYIDSMRRIRYLFPKAHAAAYTLLSFRVAWYKAHYPLEYYVTMLNRIDGEDAFEPDDFLKEAADLKIEINRLTDDDDPMWKYGYESDRLQALKLVCDAREHGMKFVREKTELEHRFSAGDDHSICVSESVMGDWQPF